MRRAIAVLVISGCYSTPPELCTPGEACRQLVIHKGSTGDLADVPLLVELDPATIDYALVVDPPHDLRFHDSVSDRDLPFEIDRWQPGGFSDVWIRQPAMVGPGPFLGTTLYYGPDAHGAADPAGVWSDFDLVEHFGATLESSASASYPPTATNITTADGEIGTAAKLTGTGQETIEFAGSSTLLGGWPTFTIELWIWPDFGSASELGNQPGILEELGPVNGGRLFAVGSDAVFQADLSFTNNSTEYLNTSVPLRAWTYLVYTYDNSVLNLYANGLLVATEPKPSHASLVPPSGPLVLGRNDHAMRGLIDEVRISRQPRSPAWILEQQASANRELISFAPGN